MKYFYLIILFVGSSFLFSISNIVASPNTNYFRISLNNINNVTSGTSFLIAKYQSTNSEYATNDKSNTNLIFGIIISVLLICSLVLLYFYLQLRKNQKYLYYKIVELENEIQNKSDKLSRKEELIKEKEKQVQEKELLLKDINTKKDKFLSIVSQDLKAPLNSLVGFTELFILEIDHVDKSKTKELAHYFRKSIKNLSNLLENLLEWSRMQIGVKYFHPAKVDISALLSKNINLLKDQAHQKNLNINFSKNGQLFVLADVNMINSVIRHLISNAIKFSPQNKEIDISYVISGDYCEVKVKDNGVGLDESSIQKVFKIDKHFTTEGTKKEKGTGLGLILCKEFIEKNNGKIWLESEVGKGTSAYFTIKMFPE